MHQPRYGLAATLGLDGKVYVAGGYNAAGVAVNTLEIYDPVAQTWTIGQSMGVPRAYLAVATGPNGRIYADTSLIAHLSVEGTTVKQRRPVLLLAVEKAAGETKPQLAHEISASRKVNGRAQRGQTI